MAYLFLIKSMFLLHGKSTYHFSFPAISLEIFNRHFNFLLFNVWLNCIISMYRKLYDLDCNSWLIGTSDFESSQNRQVQLENSKHYEHLLIRNCRRRLCDFLFIVLSTKLWIIWGHAIFNLVYILLNKNIVDIRLQVSLKFRFVSFVQFHLSKHSDFLNLAVLMCHCHDSLIGTPAGRRVRGCGHGDVKSGIQGRKEKLLSLYLL